MSIEVQNVTKTFGPFKALEAVNLKVGTGELIALLGPSGSGKTTLLRIIAGLEVPDGGEILFHGEDARAKRAKDRNVGFVFQHYGLFRHMTVFENIAFGLRVKPKQTRPNKKELNDKVHELLKLVQLDWVASRYPSQLSGGQRQRIALARALAVQPKVLLLDEPFGSLDAKVRKELRQWLRKFHDELGITTIFVTHDQEEALEVADKIVVMNEGRIEQTGTPDEVYHRPANAFVLGFLGNVNLFHCRAEEGGKTDLRQVYVRPHHFEIRRTPVGERSFKATVQHLNPAGALVKLELRTEWGDFINVEISQETFQELALKKDEEVYVSPKRFAFGEYSI